MARRLIRGRASSRRQPNVHRAALSLPLGVLEPVDRSLIAAGPSATRNERPTDAVADTRTLASAAADSGPLAQQNEHVSTDHPARPETLVSVDIETAGPNPHDFAMLSIGACLVDDPETGFYVELQPTTDRVVPSALAVSGLSMETLTIEGMPAVDAMRALQSWLAEVTPEGSRPIMVAFNAPFDWMFIADYFYRFLGENPFGHSAIDVKAFALGAFGGDWASTSMPILAQLFRPGTVLAHNALSDAVDQAHLFQEIRRAAAAR